MPTITLLGWLHTILGVFAILIGFYTLAKNKVIQIQYKSGKIYLLLTLITALTALGIYHQGGFNMAHILAILTLLAVLVGASAEKYKLFGNLSPYIQAVCFSGTLLFHMIPAITDGLFRLPVDAPIVNDIQDPLLLKFYICFLATYFLGVIMQISYLRK
jgi:uncharacterized membrane protein